jgi:hypothetical protein
MIRFFFFFPFIQSSPKSLLLLVTRPSRSQPMLVPLPTEKKMEHSRVFLLDLGLQATKILHVKAKKRVFFFAILPSLFFSSPSLSPTMLDFFWIFTKGGIILWSFQSFPIRGNPVNDLIQNILLEVSLFFLIFSPFRPFHPRLLSFDLVEIGAFRHHIVYCGPVPHEVDLCQ